MWITRHHNGDTEDPIMIATPNKRWDPIEDCWIYEVELDHGSDETPPELVELVGMS